MKYSLLLLILILTSCSFDKHSSYWNEDKIQKTVNDKKISKIVNKTGNFETMTFEEFNIFLKDYSDKTDYPDLNN